MSSDDAIARLEPALVWERFLELTRIARPSKEEDAARAHVLAWAAGRGFASEVDDEGNVVVRVPGSAGREKAATVVLQAHLDMVCERDPSSPFDPREGRISVVLDGDWVAAEGTTLGADNGIGVAAALAAADDPAVTHGPLELLFTVSEEQGLDGAKALNPALVHGRLLLNLDGGDERAAIIVGCAGSIHTLARVVLAPALASSSSAGAEGSSFEIRLSGARGGHSGEDIAKGRVSALKALGRVLAAAHAAAPFRLAALEGGASRNAIPREARAVIVLPASDVAAFRAAAERELAALREQFAGTDDELELLIEETSPSDAADPATTQRVLDLVATLPSGVLAMTPGLPASVETSTCLTTAATEDGVLTLGSMTRSSNARALDEVEVTVAAASRLAGAELEVRRSYPPWVPDLDSGLLTTARKTFERIYDEEPALKVVHGGLECAVIGGRIPGIEMISIGVHVESAHAPGEQVSVSSTQSFYRLLGALLDDLSP